jgi:hypothetical protein
MLFADIAAFGFSHMSASVDIALPLGIKVKKG